MPMAEAKKPVLPAEEEEPWVSTDKKFLVDQEEPVGQGQPVPHLIPSAQDVEPKPALAESQEKPLEQRPTRIEPESAAIAAIAGKDSPQPPVPAPTFVAKTIASNPPASVARELTALKSEPPMVPEQAPTRLEPETAAIVALAVRASP
jgi:hypothetical protein